MERPGEPKLTLPVHAALRLAVARFRQGEPRRAFPPVVHVGFPGGPDVEFVETAGQTLDQALRAEVVAALLSRAQNGAARPVVWLTRAGQLGVEDVDLRWYAAASAAFGEAGVPLAMVVVTRSGWRDLLTGTGREWKRLRIRG